MIRRLILAAALAAAPAALGQGGREVQCLAGTCSIEQHLLEGIYIDDSL